MDGVPAAPPRRVQKRDGRLVPFDREKIAAAIRKAARSVGEADTVMADELAEVVEHFLATRADGTQPHIEQIQDLVEKVLMETGHAAVAKSYILYRDRRSQVRERVRIRETRPGLDDAADILVGVQGDGLAPWSKGRIVDALIKEAGLEFEVAVDVASAVEKKVFKSGLGRISTALIRELVDNELFELGYCARLQKQQIVGMPRFDLEALARSPRLPSEREAGRPVRELRDGILSATLRQAALDIVYPPATVEAHLHGDLDLGHLAAVDRLDRVTVSLPPSADLDAAAEALWAAGTRAERVVVFGASRRWLAAAGTLLLKAVARPTGAVWMLVLGWEDLCALAEPAWLRLRASGVQLAALLPDGGDRLDEAGCARLGDGGEVLLLTPQAADELRRPLPRRIALDGLRLAQRAGEGAVEDFWQALLLCARTAAGGFNAGYRWLTDLHGEIAAGARFSLDLFGFVGAIQFLTGVDPAEDGEVRALCETTLDRLQGGLQDLPLPVDLSLRPGPRAAARLARLDGDEGGRPPDPERLLALAPLVNRLGGADLACGPSRLRSQVAPWDELRRAVPSLRIAVAPRHDALKGAHLPW